MWNVGNARLLPATYTSSSFEYTFSSVPVNVKMLFPVMSSRVMLGDSVWGTNVKTFVVLIPEANNVAREHCPCCTHTGSIASSANILLSCTQNMLMTSNRCGTECTMATQTISAFTTEGSNGRGWQFQVQQRFSAMAVSPRDGEFVTLADDGDDVSIVLCLTNCCAGMRGGY